MTNLGRFRSLFPVPHLFLHTHDVLEALCSRRRTRPFTMAPSQPSNAASTSVQVGESLVQQRIPTRVQFTPPQLSAFALPISTTLLPFQPASSVISSMPPRTPLSAWMPLLPPVLVRLLRPYLPRPTTPKSRCSPSTKSTLLPLLNMLCSSPPRNPSSRVLWKVSTAPSWPTVRPVVGRRLP